MVAEQQGKHVRRNKSEGTGLLHEERGCKMILTDYYKFERVATKAKHRMDCTASTNSYPEFEDRRKAKAQRETEKRNAINVGDLLIYWVAPDGHIRADRKRKADRSITINSDNLSSVYNVQRDNDCWFAFGDFKGTADALLFIYNVTEVNATIQAGSVIEVFVARGWADKCNMLCNLYSDGELDEEIETLRKQVTKSVTVPN